MNFFNSNWQNLDKFSKKQKNKNIYISGNLTTSISDHFPQFTTIENPLSDSLIKKTRKS